MSTRSAPSALPTTGHAGTLVTSAGRIPRLLLLAWALLLFNVLAPSANLTLVPIPRSIAQALAQGSLVLALAVALLLNRHLVIRPNHLLVLLTVLAVMSLVASLHNEFVFGSVYRGLRLLAFVACLWLLTPWWGRRDMVLLRAHRVCLWVVLGTVVVGAALAPGKAFSFEGRLSGDLWPMPPPQVAHYAAVLFGTSVILWMCRVITGRHTLLAVGLATGVLVGTHTRTAIAGTVIGLAIASASLFLGHARVRRVSASTLLGLGAAVLLFAPQIVTWLARGQSAEDATQLTGRTKVWSDVFATPRPALEQFFGSGLSNKSFQGLADRQQLGGDLPRPGLVRHGRRGGRARAAPADGRHPRPRPAPRDRAVPHRLLHRRVRHRDRARRRLPVPARPRRRGVPARVTTAAGGPVKVVVVHGRYRSTAPSGENHVVDQERAALHRGRPLRQHVRAAQRRHRRLAAAPQGRAAAAQRPDQEARRDLARHLRAGTARRRPRAQHVPAAQPLGAAGLRRRGVPVVATMHNYKLLCASGDFFRDGRPCHDCARGRGAPGLVHGCYRGSRLATAPVVLGSVANRDEWRRLVSAYVFISGAQRDLMAAHKP